MRTSRQECDESGHSMYSDLMAKMAPTEVIKYDWCVRCGLPGETKPHMVIKGERKVVEDVEPPEGLL